MKKLITLIFLIFVTFSVLHSQKEYYKWKNGNFILDFNKRGFPANAVNSNLDYDRNNSGINLNQGNSVHTFICDSNGKLLFYADELYTEVFVNSKNNKIIKNKNQNSDIHDIIVTPGKSRSIYFVVRSFRRYDKEYIGIEKFELSIPDEEIINYTYSEKRKYTRNFEVTHHFNNENFWFVVVDDKRRIIESYLIDNDIDLNDPEFVIDYNYYWLQNYYPRLEISPNSKFLYLEFGNSKLLYMFDNRTGSIKFLDSLYHDQSLNKSSFSGDSKYLYLSDYDGPKNEDVHIKYKLNFDYKNNVFNGTTLINSIKNFSSTNRSDINLAPDGNQYNMRVRNKHDAEKINFRYYYIGRYDIDPIVYGDNFLEWDLTNNIPWAPGDFWMPKIINSYLDMNYIFVCENKPLKLNDDDDRIWEGSNFQWELIQLDTLMLDIENKINDELNNFDGDKFPILNNINENYTGRYLVKFTDTAGIYRKKHIRVYVDPIPKDIEIEAIKLSDTCEKLIYLLKPEKINEKYNYSWNTGAETPEITVDEEGLYTLYVNNKSGCIDSAKYVFKDTNNLTLNIESDGVKCFGELNKLKVKENFNKYLWSTGETSKSIEVTKADEYWVKVETESGCTLSDTIKVDYYDRVLVELKPAPTSICEGDTITLESKYAADYYDYQWNTEESTRSIKVTETGTYKLVITDTRTGCKDSTEKTIEVEDELKPVITGSDICDGGTTTLSVLPNDPEVYTYEWSDGVTGQSREVSSPGEYIVEVSRENCFGIDTIEIEEHTNPEFTIEGDTIVCEGETTTLTSSKEFEEYFWSNGETTKSITVGEGDYTLAVTDENGCTNTEQFSVDKKAVELTFESMKYDFGKIYISETRDTTIEITNNSGEEVTAIIDGDPVNIPEDGYRHQYNLDNSSIGAKQNFITIQVTEPCEAEYQIEITAEVYARVTLSTINIHTEIGATETIPYYIEAESDLGEQIFNITTDIDRDLFFTNDSYQIPNPQVINQQRTQIHEQTGMILLTEHSNYPITFPQVEFDNPYIEAEADSGKITFDSVCIHDLRVVEIHEPTEISVAPNPARDVINIDISTGEEGNFTMELISTEGRTTYTDSWNQSSSSKNIQIDTRDISTGVYQLRLTTEGHIYRKEVVVVE